MSESKPKLEFRLALEMVPETVIWEVSNLFKQELEKSSEEFGIEAGEIVVNFYDRGSIGSERQLLESCYFGAIEVVQINTTLVSTLEPSYALMNLPYLFTSKEHHNAVIRGEVGQQLLNMISENRLYGLGLYSTGFRNIFYKNPTDLPCADSPEGFRGLKIRVMESPIMINSINAMGPSATPIPFSELYQSLKTGVVDGAENSAKIFNTYEYEETGCNCYTLTEHSTDQHILVANEEWITSLPSRYRNRIEKVAEEIHDRYDSIWDATTESALKEMKANQVTVNELADKSAFVESVRHVHDQFFELYPEVDRTLYDRIKSYQRP